MNGVRDLVGYSTRLACGANILRLIAAVFLLIVTFTAQAAALVVNGFAASYSTTSSPYTQTINLTGSGFNSVTQISWSCTMPSGSSCPAITPWTTANNFNGKFTRSSDTVASVSPTLIAIGDPAGTWQWSVTFSTGSQSVTKTFSVVCPSSDNLRQMAV